MSGLAVGKSGPEGILESLKDLDGIIGSLLVARSGAVLVQDLPSYFGSAAYDVAPRALRLEESVALGRGPVTFGVLRFGGHKLSFRPAGESLLWVLTNAEVNMAALRMAMNLVARKLEKVRFEPSPTPPPPTARPSATPEAERQARAVTAAESDALKPNHPRPVYFRGKRIS